MSLDLNEVVLGVVESPTSLSLPACGTQLAVTGWAVHASGIRRVSLLCNGEERADALMGMRRVDVAAAFPEIASAVRAGFMGALDISNLAAGRHELRTVVIANSGHQYTWVTPFTLLDETRRYERWLTVNHPPPGAPVHLARGSWASQGGPSIGIAVDATSASANDVARTLDSLAAQTGSAAQVIVVGQAGGLSRTRTSLLSLGTDFVGFLQAGDVLREHALAAFTGNFARNPKLDLVYADHDRWSAAGRSSPVFKPSWSPLLLADHDYIGRCWLARRKLIARCSAAAFDDDGWPLQPALLAELGRLARHVGHVASVLLSEPDGEALPPSPYQRPKGVRQGVRKAIIARASMPQSTQRVSVIIPTRASHPDLLRQCLNSLFGVTNYSNLEVIVVLNNAPDWAAAEALLGEWPVKVMHWKGKFNWSAINNRGAAAAKGELLLFLNDDVVALDDRWLHEMVALAAQPDVGAVGALLRYPNGQIQHGGVWLPWGAYFEGRHAFRFCTGNESALAPLLSSNREQSAVTGACLLSRRDCYQAVAGFDETLALVFNDVDYCVRLGTLGWKSVMAGRAVLTHHEGVSRAGMSEDEDADFFMDRWRDNLPETDPYSNPNLDARRDDWVFDTAAVGSLVARVSAGSEPVRRLAPVRPIVPPHHHKHSAP